MNIKQLQVHIDGLIERASQARAESERLASDAVNYDANGIPTEAEANRKLSTQRLSDAVRLQEEAEDARRELLSMQSEVDALNARIFELQAKRDGMTG